MFTCPENRPLVDPIPFKIGHSVNPIPFLGDFGSMVCLAWSPAVFQGKQEGSEQVGGGERHIHTGGKVSPGDIPAHPDRLGVNTQLMSRVDKGQGRSYSVEEPKSWELSYTS